MEAPDSFVKRALPAQDRIANHLHHFSVRPAVIKREPPLLN